MTQILNDLARIDFSDDILERLDLTGIYDSFRKNYRKLDDLKNARSEHEERNALMRWWHSDKLQEAQLDSAEVQAEFSKTIGQLMLISIMQSKKLVEQQTQLNAQQGKLKAQAEGIAQQASELQLQHHRLADQSIKLERLVHEYFELKGLTEEGAARLIEIATEVKSTKEDMLQRFADKVRQIDSTYRSVTGQIDSLSSQVNSQLHRHDERAQSAIKELQSAVTTKVEQCNDTVRERYGALQNELRELGARATDVASAQSKAGAELVSCKQQQQMLLESFENYRNEVSARFKRLSYVCVALGLGLAGSLAGVMIVLK